ncbi:hypothetical protein ONS96_014966 [Cadophora gregata f. sp. sojae]|nr:hypothetical protein ONS96_014966 [Cadophora gregata f. sp. sojae]
MVPVGCDGAWYWIGEAFAEDVLGLRSVPVAAFSRNKKSKFCTVLFCDPIAWGEYITSDWIGLFGTLRAEDRDIIAL